MLRFRNVDLDPSEPVESWPIEGIQTALERGTLVDWRRMFRAIDADPWGPFTREVEYVLCYDRPYGTAELFERGIARSCARAEAWEKAVVSQNLARALADSGLSARAFAERLGTSASRMSTYVSGKVTPSATLMVRAGLLSSSERNPRIQAATLRPARPGPKEDRLV